MSFMNKVKNFFYEDVEEYDEPVVEEPKKKIDLNFFKKKEKSNEVETREERVKEIIPEKKNENLSERELFKAERTFNFPMDLDEKIFDNEEEEKTEVIYREQEVVKKPIQRTEAPRPVTPTYTKPVYQNISREQPKKETEHKFHPSPVISPVYGILDKNYTVDDVVEKNLDKTKEFSFDKKIVDFDTVRNRAYKELDDELEKTLTGNTDIFYNLTEEEPKEIPEEEKELEDSPVIITYNEEEIKPEEAKVDEMPSIPTLEEESNIHEEEKDEEPSIKQEEEEDEDDFSPDVKIEETRSKKNRRVSKESKKEEEEKEDLFNLIDNMYSEDDEEDDE